MLRFIAEAGFNPDTISAMTAAFDEARKELGLADKNDPLAQMVAREIVEIAKMGERDPTRICQLALAAVRR